MDVDDRQLIDEFVARNSEAAFGALVNRYINLVHSAAARQVRDSQLAQEVTQAVFILLARKIAGLPRQVLLPGWLYRTTRFVAARAMRAEQRRHRREQEAFAMQQLSSADQTWQRLAPLLDNAMDQLGETDRNALVLRYFQDEPLQRVGASLGISEEAARKRVDRSLEKLRSFFGRHGFTISAGVLATALGTRTVEAVPSGLANSVSAAALAPTGAAALTSMLVRETLNAWRWTKIKLGAGVIGGAALLTAALLPNGVIGKSPSGSGTQSLAENSKANSDSTSVSGDPANPIANAVSNSPGSPTNDGPVVKFQAIDAATGKGIAGAMVLTVTAQDRDHVNIRTNLVTDSKGRCEISIGPANPLMLVLGVLADGYEQRCLVCGGPNGSDPLPQDYILKVPRGSRIGGIVNDEAGKPVADAQIFVQFQGTGDASWREFQRERPGFPAEDLPVARTDRKS